MANDKQKQILQFLLHKPMVSAREFQEAYRIVFERPANLDDIKTLVSTLNGILTPIQLAIKHRLCEDTNGDYWALINLTETEASKHILEFTPPELDYLKQILKGIVTSGTGAISSMECINLTASIQKLTKTDGQKVLEKFVASQWLKLSNDGEVSLTPRTLLELDPLLRKLEPDLGECVICHALAVKVIICPNEECSSRVHRFCLSKLSRGTNSVLKCPQCRRPWTLPSVEDSSSATSSNHSQSPTPDEPVAGPSNNGTQRRTAAGRRSSKRVMAIASSSEDSD